MHSFFDVIDWLIDWLIYGLVGWLIDLMTEWLIDEYLRFCSDRGVIAEFESWFTGSAR